MARVVAVLPDVGYVTDDVRSTLPFSRLRLVAIGLLGLSLIWGGGPQRARSGGHLARRRSILQIVRRNLLLRQPR